MELKHRQKNSVGVVGGGQLARMLAIAGQKLGIKVFVQTPQDSDPAVINANGRVLSDTKDINGTKSLAQITKCITFENEWIDIDGLSLLEDSGVSFIPKLSAMGPLVNKLLQRRLLNKLDIPGPEWISLSSLKVTELELPEGFRFPLMAKSSVGGYDGKGTKVINDFSDLKQLFKTVSPKQWFLEKWINYEKELSLVVSRDNYGIVRTFPLSETFQSEQICDWVLAPADVSYCVNVMATNLATSLVRELDYVGVLAVEFFYGEDGLLVNEIAPRTHNSAHLTIEACNSSQFDHQISIASGLQVKSTELVCPGAIMINLLGYDDDESVDNRLTRLKRISGLNIHWYQKDKNLIGRKMGHVTKILDETDSEARKLKAIQLLKEVRDIWPIN